MIRNLILMDTSALYPLFLRDDDLNPICAQILHELMDKYRAEFLTTTWVTHETLSKLKKHGINFCLNFKKLLEELNIKVEYVSKPLETRALELFWHFRDKEWSIVDCVSIALMQDRNIQYVFAIDEHFSQAGLFPLMKYDSNGNPIKSYTELYFY